MESNEPIDVEYWEQLLSSIAIYRAKAELNQVYKYIIDSRLANLRQQQASEAMVVKEKLALLLPRSNEIQKGSGGLSIPRDTDLLFEPTVQYSRQFDREPLLKLRSEDRASDVIEEAEFISKIVSFDTFQKGSTYSDSKHKESRKA